MSLHISHTSDAIVVRACPVVNGDCLLQLHSVLDNLVTMADRLVLDLSDVPMVPTPGVRRFMGELSYYRMTSSTSIVVVVSRSTGRELLRSLAPEDTVPIVASVDTALELELS